MVQASRHSAVTARAAPHFSEREITTFTAAQMLRRTAQSVMGEDEGVLRWEIHITLQ